MRAIPRIVTLGLLLVTATLSLPSAAAQTMCDPPEVEGDGTEAVSAASVFSIGGQCGLPCGGPGWKRIVGVSGFWNDHNGNGLIDVYAVDDDRNEISPTGGSAWVRVTGSGGGVFFRSLPYSASTNTYERTLFIPTFASPVVYTFGGAISGQVICTFP